jgi:hypothetical protein
MIKFTGISNPHTSCQKKTPLNKLEEAQKILLLLFKKLKKAAAQTKLHYKQLVWAPTNLIIWARKDMR